MPTSEDSGLPDYLSEVLDMATFEQILEMDDSEEEREFSTNIIFDFFSQAEDTFTSMDESLKKSDLQRLSELGHFLKGSSATLGITKLRDACEKIQHYGARMDETGTHSEPDEKKSLEGCKTNIDLAKQHFAAAEKALRRFYGPLAPDYQG